MNNYFREYELCKNIILDLINVSHVNIINEF